MSVRADRAVPQTPVIVEGREFRSDYADAFEVIPSDQRSAEQWARGTLEQGPLALRWFVSIGWRLVLRLRLRPGRSNDHVAGWPILLRSREIVVLGVESGALGHARLTFRVGSSSVSVGTNIQFSRRGGRTIWSFVGALHRQILPFSLGHAASSPARP